MASTRLLRPRRKPGILPALLLTALAGAASLPTARAANVIRSVQTVFHKGFPVTYDITLYSDTEFPMRDEVIYLSIGGRQFINSHYLQGSTLNTIVFSLTPGDFASLKNGDPVVVFYTQDDASNPNAQWMFGNFRKAIFVSSAPGGPVSEVSVAKKAAKRGHK